MTPAASWRQASFIVRNPKLAPGEIAHGRTSIEGIPSGLRRRRVERKREPARVLRQRQRLRRAAQHGAGIVVVERDDIAAERSDRRD